MICPAGLTISDHARFAFGVRMQRDDFFKKDSLGGRDIFNGLSRHRVRQKPNEVTSMACIERDLILTVGLKAADAGAVTPAGIHNHKGPPHGIDLYPFRRNDARQAIVHGPRSVRPSRISSAA